MVTIKQRNETHVRIIENARTMSNAEIEEIINDACWRIFLDERQMPTIDTVSKRVRYSNRKVLGELLKRWKQELVERYRQKEAGGESEIPEVIHQLWHKALNEAAKTLASERQAIETEKRTLNQAKERWQQSLAEREREIVDLKEAIKVMAEEKVALTQALQDTQKKLLEACEKAGMLSGQVEILKRQYDEMKEVANKQVEQTIQSRLVDLRMEVNNLTRERDKAKTRLQEYEARIETLIAQIGRKDEQTEKLEAQVADLQRQLAELTTKLAEQAKELDYYRNIEAKDWSQAIRKLPDIKKVTGEFLKTLKPKDVRGETVNLKRLVCTDVTLNIDVDGNAWFQVFINGANQGSLKLQKMVREHLESAGFGDVQVVCDW